jgi:choline monooxygenase
MDSLSPTRGLARSDIFDPASYQGVRRSFDVAETLPSWCYTAEEFHRREVERIFFRAWNCIGHAMRVGAAAGSYITLEFCEVPIVVVRGADLALRAFINSCRHRGSLIMEGEGTCARLQCPYHAWAFSLTGELIGTPMFEEHESFRKADHALTPVKLEIWAGLIWINLDPASPSLAEHLGDLVERTAPYRADEMVCVWRKDYPLGANWKLFCENFSDGYHVPFVHRGTLTRQRVYGRDFHDPAIHRGSYLMHFTRVEGTRGVLAGEDHFAMIEDLPEHLRGGTFYPHVYANATLGFNVDSMIAIEIYPEGATRSRLGVSVMMPKTNLESPNYERIAPNYWASIDVVVPEDIRAAELQQAGLKSSFTRRGRFTPQDRLVHDYQNWILDRVLG